MIPAALVRNAAASLEGDELDDALFYLFEDHMEHQLEQIGRVSTWQRLNQQEVKEGFRRFLTRKLSELGDEPNQATRDLHRQLRERYFSEQLKELRSIWSQCVADTSTAVHPVQQPGTGANP